jgi:hypothetical protein
VFFLRKQKINHGIGSAKIMSSGANRQFVNKIVIISIATRLLVVHAAPKIK